MIQDRSFDAMALALGFPPANATAPLRPPSNQVSEIHKYPTLIFCSKSKHCALRLYSNVLWHGYLVS